MSPGEEVVLSDPANEILCCGVGLALFITSNASKNPWYCDTFDESAIEIAPTVLLYHAPKHDLEMFVRNMVSYLDLTSAELVTAYVLYESLLRANQCDTSSRRCVRTLFTTCISLAVRTLSDEAFTLKLFAFVVTSNGFQLTGKRLAQMERVVLEALKYRTLFQPDVYRTYSCELTRLFDPSATPPRLGMP